MQRNRLQAQGALGVCFRHADFIEELLFEQMMPASALEHLCGHVCPVVLNKAKGMHEVA